MGTRLSTDLEEIGLGPSSLKREGESSNHLPFLDGLRGLAALSVAIGHAYGTYRFEPSSYQPARFAALEILGGSHAVALFIVLSGFCLMMPVARSGDERLRGGAGRYFKRRAWRILPPYYAALALSLAILASLPAQNVSDSAFLRLVLPAFRFDVIASHLLMIYNLHSSWVLKINPPFWSVATEWQIYFLFPFLLIPIWRRFGPMATIAVGLAVGLAPHVLLGHTSYSVSVGRPWYSGLFAMGMVAAGICFTPAGTRGWGTDFVWKWAGSATIFLLAMVAGLARFTNWNESKHVPFDVLEGLAAASLLIWCYRQRVGQGRGFVIRILECTPVVFLGAISYSLYLMHAPILFLAHRLSRPWQTSSASAAIIMLVGAVPVSVLLCSGFHFAFERPFMNSGPRRKSLPADNAGESAPDRGTVLVG